MPIINMVYKKKKWWKPWANTLLYLPLNSTDTYTDKSWKNRTTTNYNVQFWTYQWVDCWYFNNAHIQINTLYQHTYPLTVACWCYNTWYTADGKIYDTCDNVSNRLTVYYTPTSSRWYTITNKWPEFSANWQYQNRWVLFVATYTSDTKIRYLKWNSLDLSDSNSNSWATSFTPTYTNVWNEWNNAANRYFLWYMSNLIVENKERTAQEIADYYNQTKANYWL